MAFSVSSRNNSGMASTSPPPSMIVSGLRIIISWEQRMPILKAAMRTSRSNEFVTALDGPLHGSAANVGNVSTGFLPQIVGLAAGYKQCKIGSDDFSAAIGLKTSGTSATANWAVGIKSDMADFTGRAGCAVQNFPIDDYASADACAGKNTNAMGGAFGSAKMEFAIGAHVDVVVDGDFTTEFFREFFGQWKIFPWEGLGGP